MPKFVEQEEEDPIEFLEAIQASKPSQQRSNPPVIDYGEEGPLVFLEELREIDKPSSTSVTDEDLVRLVLDQVPDSNTEYLRKLTEHKEFVHAILGPLSKRARYVRDLILRYGFTTTEQVKERYDPMAIRDLEERGITLTRRTVRGDNKRVTTRYTFDPSSFKQWRESRLSLPSKFREQLLHSHDYKCSICRAIYDKKVLEADHCVPYQIVGNDLVRAEGLQALQPACPSCNTDKHKVCALCANMSEKDVNVCRSCYWASPSSYTHIATKSERRLVLVARTPEQITALLHIQQTYE
jgi:hypothetical protein